MWAHEGSNDAGSDGDALEEDADASDGDDLGEEDDAGSDGDDLEEDAGILELGRCPKYEYTAKVVGNLPLIAIAIKPLSIINHS